MGEVVPIQPFLALVADVPWRDNRDVMAYPFLSLQKRRTEPIEYAKDDVFVEVHSPTKFGIASIWDWDVIIYAASQLNVGVEAGLDVSPILEFPPYDLLRQVGRPIGGQHYHELASAIRRLRMTTIVTTVRIDDGAGVEEPFSWLIGYRLPKRYSPFATITPDAPDGEADPAKPWQIHLPNWLFACIMRQAEILAVHPEYFRLTGGLERWLYRLARKSVPDKAETPAITFRMQSLHERSGVINDLRHFAHRIRRIAARQPLPEYSLAIERDGRGEVVTLYRAPTKSARPRRARKRASKA